MALRSWITFALFRGTGAWKRMVVDVMTWKRGTSLHTRMKVGKANAQDQDEEVFGKACLWDYDTRLTTPDSG